MTGETQFRFLSRMKEPVSLPHENPRGSETGSFSIGSGAVKPLSRISFRNSVVHSLLVTLSNHTFLGVRSYNWPCPYDHLLGMAPRRCPGSGGLVCGFPDRPGRVNNISGVRTPMALASASTNRRYSAL